jgi:hypothetical protein
MSCLDCLLLIPIPIVCSDFPFVCLHTCSETCEVTFVILHRVTVPTVQWFSLISCLHCLIVVTIRIDSVTVSLL